MSRTSLVAPFKDLRVSKHQIPAWNGIPNTSIQGKPVLIYHGAFREATASQIESHLKTVGAVTPQWRYTMYSTTHFHSTTHEVLGVASGAAKICLGGEENPGRIEPVVRQGDVLVLPAGVGHRLLQDMGDFQMVGSYPVGHEWDMCYGRAGEEDKVEKIKDLEWFKRDPIYDADGPVLNE